MCLCCAAYAASPAASRLNKNVYKYFCLIITAFVVVFLVAVAVVAVAAAAAVAALVININYCFIS